MTDPDGMSLLLRVQRIEYILIRIATTSPDALPRDAHEKIAEMVREAEAFDEAIDEAEEIM